MIVEIQVLPTPRGTEAAPYEHVDAAIAVIQASGMRYEVGALGTTIEGEADEAWAVARQAHEACLAAGALSVVTIVKAAQAAADATQIGIDDLVGKFRA